MISKQDIKDLEFNTIEEFFNYVLESEINGNRSQVRAFINDMSKAQKKACILFLHDDILLSEDANTVSDLILDSL